MSKPGRHQRIIHDYRQRLARHEKQAEQQLEQAYAHVLRTINPVLDRLYQDMTNILARGEKIPPHFLYEANRLQAIKSLIETSVDHFGAYSRAQVAQLQQWAAHLGQESAMEMLHATLPEGVSWTFGRPSTEAIANIVGATQKGSPLSDLFEGFGREASDLAGKALVTGVTLGKNPRQIAPLVMQALGISRNRALTISRTESLRAYRDSSLETMRANSDVVNGWIWSAALGTACAVCTAMNGSKHTLDETLDAHPNCRCVMLPETKGWDEILGDLGIDASNIPDTRVQVEDGSDWFANQSDAMQLSILGSKAAFDLYKSGDADLSDFVGWNESDDWGRSIYQKSAKQVAKASK